MQEMDLSNAVTKTRIGKPRVHGLLPALLLTVGYYCAARIGFSLTLQPAAIPILWPPNAVLLSGLLMSPPHNWGLILLMVFFPQLVAQLQSGVPFALALGWFVSNCGAVLLGAACVRGALRRQWLRFDSLRDVIAFLFWCAFLIPFVSSFLDIAPVKALEGQTGGFWQLWRLRFFSNAVAMLAVAPVLLSWHPGIFFTARKATPPRRWEGGLMACALLCVGSLSLMAWPASFAHLLFYAPLPILLWFALRFEPFIASASFLLFSFLTTWSTLHGRSPFIQGSAYGGILSFQLFLAGMAVPLLLLSALAQELRKSLHCQMQGGARLQLRAEWAQQDRESETPKQCEQLFHLARVAVLGELSGALTHELNQPLASILTNAQAARRFMSREPVDLHEIREILDDIADEGKRAGEVIRRLRALFMKGEPKVQPLEINELVRETLALTHSELIERKVPVSLHLGTAPMRVLGDRVQLQQVLLNLIVNACDAMSGKPSQARRLNLTTGVDKAGNVRVAVADTGSGIAPDVFDKIFESFFTTKAQGMGFGLSISRTIIDEHGGHIDAANNPGGGATFRITLPAHVGVLS